MRTREFGAEAPELLHAAVAYGRLLRADCPLPGEGFAVGRRPEDELQLRRGELTESLAGLDRRFTTEAAVPRELVLRSGPAAGRGESSGPDRPLWALEAVNVVTFAWREGCGKVIYEPGADFTTDLFGFLLLHSFLPVYLAVNRSHHLLHAGCVEVEGRAVVFIAPSMGGKSTLTAEFVRAGHGLLSDDKLATFRRNGEFRAVGAYPFLRPYRELESLGERCERFVAGDRPIGGVFVLHPVDAEAEPRVEPLAGGERFRQLVSGHDVLLPFQRDQDFRFFAALADRVSVNRLTVPWSLSRLAEVRETVLAAAH